MKTRMLALIALLVALTGFSAPSEAVASTVRLDGVTVHLKDGTRQVVTVNRTDGHHARVTLWGYSDGRWQQRMQATDGRIGYGGLVVARHRRQGTGTTPLGTFGLPSAFGMHARDAAWALPYRQVRRGDFWVEDNGSRYYNRFRNQSQGGFRWWLPSSDPNASERLTDYRTQYEWSILVGFNRGQVRHRGAGIFLHVNGSGATAGCVSAPRWFIKRLMARLDPAYRPLIAIGR
ncbi:L,D-transpeptidase family protein [Nocardioides hankookensis]|uniref:L,D-transpeptidase family protein n=1 Tax=Nocardioides hankookensis TaxID=443157 RepID=A0ABW1LRU3_9ACTN